MINRKKTKQVYGYYPEELTQQSNKKIIVTCDYCKSDIEKVKAKWINQQEDSLVKKDCCLGCRGKKIEEANLLYPEINTNRLKKMKTTCLDRYGVENYLLSDEGKTKIKESLDNRTDEEKAASSIKRKQTNLERYGVVNPMQNEEIRKKAQKTCLENFGAESFFLLPDWPEKLKAIMQEKYGVDNSAHLESTQNKRKQTNLKKLGVECNLSDPDTQERIKQTNIKLYGFENPLSSLEIQEKRHNTNLEKYGVANVGANKEIQKKIAASKAKYGTVTTSKQQFYINNLFGGILNEEISYFNADIYLPNKIICEYDGGGHDLSVRLNRMTREEFNLKEMVREKTIRNEGYKIFKIVSQKDKLPSDEVLLNMLNFALEIFNTGRSWVTFDIDKSLVRWNGEEKPYNFGDLRKINLNDNE